MDTTLRNIIILVVCIIVFFVFANAVLAQSVSVEGQTYDYGWIITIVVGLAMLGAGWALKAVQTQTEMWADPRREKPEADQTLTDKAIIELDKKVDLINIDILERFLRSFVSARLPGILARVPSVGPILIAADMVQDAMREWQHRNPQTHAQMKVTKEAMKGKLAGAIGEVSKDVLTGALVKPGAPKDQIAAIDSIGDVTVQERLDLK